MKSSHVVIIFLWVFALPLIMLMIREYLARKKDGTISNNNIFVSAGAGFIGNFCDALGIGSFAVITPILRATKNVDDRVLPGTLNAGCAVSVAIQGTVWMSDIGIETKTLVVTLICSVIGGFLGAFVVTKLDRNKVRVVMGAAFIVVAFILLSKQMGFFPNIGGEANGFHGTKLAAFAVLMGCFAALMNAGIGMYAPAMALCALMGLNLSYAFPLAAGGCCAMMPTAGIRSIVAKAIDIKVAMWMFLGSIPGVLIAALIVKSMPLTVLTWLVIFVLLYTSASMILAAKQNKGAGDHSAATEPSAE